MKHKLWRMLIAAAILGLVVLGSASGSAGAPGAASPSGGENDAREGQRFSVALRAEPDARPRALRLCRANGTELAAVVPDADGDAELGSLRPGSYSLYDGEEELGKFLLAENAAILRADGRLWTDGELLHLAAREPAALSARCELARAGYYAFTLTGEDGTTRNAVLSIPRGAKQELAEGYLRSLLFEGLRAGRWQLWEGGAVCASGVLSQGETAQIELKIP